MTAYALRLQTGTDTATRMRFGDALPLTPGSGPLAARSGLRPDGGGAVTVTAGTMQVSVAPFAGWVDGTVSDAQGGYPFVSDAAVTLTLDPGDASLARVDTIAAQVRDNAFDGSGATDATVLVVKGTPGGGAPVLPANTVPLRDVNVPAGLSAGTGGLSSSNLAADRRKYVSGLGGILPVASAAERDALANPQPGLAVYRLDTSQLQVRTATGWDTYAREVANTYGTKAGTTDAGGAIVISHGLGRVPTYAAAHNVNSSHYSAVGGVSSTTITVYTRNLADGAVRTGSSETIYWEVR